MRNDLLEQLSMLSLQEKAILRRLDRKWAPSCKRATLFKQLENTKEEIKKVKFKLRLERKLKNEKFR